MEYEKQLEKLLQEYKLHEVLESHLKQFDDKEEDITRLPLEEVPLIEGRITEQENIDRHPPLERILLLSNKIELKRTKEQREKLVRERAEAVYDNRDIDRINFVSYMSGKKETPVYTDKEHFIRDSIEISEQISSLILGILTKETVDYLNRETSKISDEKLLKLFDPTIENYNFLDSRRYNLIVSFYIARQTAGLKNGIVQIFKKSVLHDLRSRYSFGTKDYEKAYKEYSVDDNTLTMLAEAKLEEHLSYDLFNDYEYKIKSIFGKKPKNKFAQAIYGGDYLTRSNNELNNSFIMRGLIPTGESITVKKGKTSKITECKYIIKTDSISIDPDYSNDSRKIEEELSNILEEYKDFIVDNKTFPVQVMQAIGSILRDADPSFDSVSISNGKVGIGREIDITTDMLKKYMYADKKARSTDKFDRDVGRVIDLLKKLQITITDTSYGDLRIVKKNLITCFPSDIYNEQGFTKGWRFSLMPPTELYATCNNQIYKIPFMKGEEKKSHSSFVKTIEAYLVGYIKKYHHRNNYELKLSYEKIIENTFGRESQHYLDVISTSPDKSVLDKRRHIYKSIDKAISFVELFLNNEYGEEVDSKIEETKKGKRTYKLLLILWPNIKEKQQDIKEKPKRTKKAKKS